MKRHYIRKILCRFPGPFGSIVFQIYAHTFGHLIASTVESPTIEQPTNLLTNWLPQFNSQRPKPPTETSRTAAQQQRDIERRRSTPSAPKSDEPLGRQRHFRFGASCTFSPIQGEPNKPGRRDQRRRDRHRITLLVHRLRLRHPTPTPRHGAKRSPEALFSFPFFSGTAASRTKRSTASDSARVSLPDSLHFATFLRHPTSGSTSGRADPSPCSPNDCGQGLHFIRDGFTLRPNDCGQGLRFSGTTTTIFTLRPNNCGQGPHKTSGPAFAASRRSPDKGVQPRRHYAACDQVT